MYVIKHVPEDFQVFEVSSVKPSSGSFTYFRLWKRDLSTLEALKRLASLFRVQLKDMACAGNKDRRAVTEQVCSVRASVRDFIFPNMKVVVIGSGPEPVHVGELEGNRFRIVVRNVDFLPEFNPRFRNLFGVQRFSSKNIDVGRHLVKREFEIAVNLLVNDFPAMKEFIAKRAWLDALRRVPRRLLLLFVHAYQSFLWNKAALLSGADILPIVGFGMEINDDATKKVLVEENVKPSDFVIRELPEISGEGAERSVWAVAKDLKVGELEDDEFFAGKKKVVLEFFLPKGCYATEFVRQNFQ